MDRPGKITQWFPNEGLNIHLVTYHTFVLPGTLLDTGVQQVTDLELTFITCYHPAKASEGSCSLKFQVGHGPLGSEAGSSRGGGRSCSSSFLKKNSHYI